MRKPKASRPYMPEYGILDEKSGKGLLPWTWARERLSKTPYYWLSTVRPDGRPHAMVVWGIWVDDTLYFSTGRQSRKAKNLQLNPRCAASVQYGDDAVVVEGVASETQDKTLIKRLSKSYKTKYGMSLDTNLGRVYRVKPLIVFGFIGASHEDDATGDFESAATRWKFELARAKASSRSRNKSRLAE